MNSTHITLVKKLLYKSMNLRNTLCWRWYSQYFIFVEAATLETLSLGDNCKFYVPVRVARGAGMLIIGAGNKFGVPFAHRQGNGEIMLQPRPAGSKITIGKGNWFNNNTVICAHKLITIGDNCQIGDQVRIYDCDLHEVDPQRRCHDIGPIKPVKIGNNVWLGSRVMVLKGVTIGDNSVVGAMSVVTRDIPADCVAVGAPTRVVRRISKG